MIHAVGGLFLSERTWLTVLRKNEGHAFIWIGTLDWHCRHNFFLSFHCFLNSRCHHTSLSTDVNIELFKHIKAEVIYMKVVWSRQPRRNIVYCEPSIIMILSEITIRIVCLMYCLWIKKCCSLDWVQFFFSFSFWNSNLSRLTLIGFQVEWLRCTCHLYYMRTVDAHPVPVLIIVCTNYESKMRYCNIVECKADAPARGRSTLCLRVLSHSMILKILIKYVEI